MVSQFVKDLNQNIGIVHRVCNLYFRYDNDEREDAFQEIMYQLWKSYPDFQRESKFSTWMYRVALNTAITHVRKSKRAPETEKITRASDLVAESSEPMDREERMNFLYAAINALSPVDKAIILLHLEEKSYDEVAAITGLTKTNVSVRLVRIKKVLEERLKHTLLTN